MAPVPAPPVRTAPGLVPLPPGAAKGPRADPDLLVHAVGVAVGRLFRPVVDTDRRPREMVPAPDEPTAVPSQARGHAVPGLDGAVGLPVDHGGDVVEVEPTTPPHAPFPAVKDRGRDGPVPLATLRPRPLVGGALVRPTMATTVVAAPGGDTGGGADGTTGRGRLVPLGVADAARTTILVPVATAVLVGAGAGVAETSPRRGTRRVASPQMDAAGVLATTAIPATAT